MDAWESRSASGRVFGTTVDSWSSIANSEFSLEASIPAIGTRRLDFGGGAMPVAAICTFDSPLPKFPAVSAMVPRAAICPACVTLHVVWPLTRGLTSTLSQLSLPGW